VILQGGGYSDALHSGPYSSLSYQENVPLHVMDAWEAHMESEVWKLTYLARSGGYTRYSCVNYREVRSLFLPLIARGS
jgi:hypothetical protein